MPFPAVPLVLTRQGLLSHWEHHDRDALCEWMGLVATLTLGCELASQRPRDSGSTCGAASGAWRQVSGTLWAVLEFGSKTENSDFSHLHDSYSNQRTSGGWDAVGGKELGELRRGEF